MKTRFESLGIFLPEKIFSTEEIEVRMSNDLRLDLERKTGIKNRRICSENENSLTLALNAAKDCLKNSSYKASDLDIIINASITRDIGGNNITFEPPFSLFIKNELDAKYAINFDISNACAGMSSGVYVLDNMIKSGVVKNGMVVSGEHNTLVSETAMNQIKDIYDDKLASLTVGDCGAAFIMDKSTTDNEGIDLIEFLTMAEYAELCVAKPSSQMQFLVMYTKSKEMNAPHVIISLPQFMDDTLKKSGKKFTNDIFDYIIPHQISNKITKLYIDAISNYFSTEPLNMLSCYEKFGNTSSTSLFLALYENLKQGKIAKDSKILFISTASGITVGLISFIIGKMKI